MSTSLWHFDNASSPLRAGVIVSNVYGGLANGFLHAQNYHPNGVRIRFSGKRVAAAIAQQCRP
jgi:hypothetical protein